MSAFWDESIFCSHCGKLVRTPDGLDIYPDIFSDEGGLDICQECYKTNIEPFEIWSEDETEIIGYRFPGDDRTFRFVEVPL